MSVLSSLQGGRITSTLGTVTIRPVVVAGEDSDVAILHRWITHPHSSFWGALEAGVEDIRREYGRIALSGDEAAWMLNLDGRPIALAETYDPARVVLNGCDVVEHRPGDIGMHILVSPTDGPPVHGLTDVLLSALMRWLFGHAGVSRVLVEPDCRNTAMHKKNARVGFGQPGLRARVPFGEATKDALVQECSPASFEMSAAAPLTCLDSDGHLAPRASADTAEAVHRTLLAKAIREFVHERILTAVDAGTGEVWEASETPHRGGDGARAPQSFQVNLGPRTLVFEAHPHQLLHLSVDPASLRVEDDPTWRPDVTEAIAEAAGQLGIPDTFLHTYLEEVSATFATRLRTAMRPAPSVTDLCDTRRDPVEHFQAFEAAMAEGHPGFLANSGRGGMGESQVRSWAPEMNTSLRLVWCAAATEHTQLTGGTQADAAEILREVAPWFPAAARAAGLDPENYVPFPVHPWQWEQRMTTAFAADIAANRLVPLCRGTDLYRPQQSLRTLFNSSRPDLPYVKTALAVRNMGFTRGLSATYMDSTPAANDWLMSQLADDPEFLDNGVGFLPEIVTIAYTGSIYHAACPEPSAADHPHLKMTAALWRRSPFDAAVRPQRKEGEHLATMAAILHRDAAGRSVVAEWIERSGASSTEWLDSLLRVYLRPLVHALVARGIVVMPHTENVILRLAEGMPVGAYHKDLGEEMAVVSHTVELPAGLERLRADVGGEDPAGWVQRALSIHTDVVDGVLRHLAALMDDEGLLDETTFWARARACLKDYASDHPDVEGTGIWAALTAPSFPHSTLNRLQLRNPHTMVDIADQNSSLIYAGSLPNPLHAPAHHEVRKPER